MKPQTIKQALDAVEESKIVMTQEDWEALLEEAKTRKELQDIYLELIKHDKFFHQQNG